jgi:hypothetical protein
LKLWVVTVVQPVNKRLAAASAIVPVPGVLGRIEII